MKYLLAICTPIPMVPGPNGPRREPVTIEWHRSRMALAYPTNCNFMDMAIDGMEVGDARNHAVKMTLEHNPRPEFLAFIDYDVLPQIDALTKLIYRARCFPDYDIFAGVYCCKSSPPEPLIYKGNGQGPFWDWTIGDLLTEGVTGVHMGLTIIRTSLLDRMDKSKPLFLTRNSTAVTDTGISSFSGTEDLFFCEKATKEAGARILVDTSVLAGHIQNGTGQIFGLPNDSPPVRRAWWMRQGKDRETEEEPAKRAIDLGAGDNKREWEGYTVDTTDIRPDVGATFVMDTRQLNLPDNSYDKVVSFHHLEHLPRWSQEQVWAEIFRICKPGGTIEHIVPNLEWAGRKLADGSVDGNVINVLYGAQEAHGEGGERWNTHYFGYTPDIARALASGAGFEDVATKSWVEDPELGYNLIITGTKPKEEEGEPGDEEHTATDCTECNGTECNRSEPASVVNKRDEQDPK